MLLLECIPDTLARRITDNSSIPVIGIGAGSDCDGQILVLQDVLGITPGMTPKFAKNFLADTHDIRSAIVAYVDAVKSSSFPLKS